MESYYYKFLLNRNFVTFEKELPHPCCLRNYEEEAAFPFLNGKEKERRVRDGEICSQIGDATGGGSGSDAATTATAIRHPRSRLGRR